MPLRDPNSPASRLNHKVRGRFAAEIAEKYRLHPEELSSEEHLERAKQESKPLLELMQDILDEINSYRILDKEDPCP